MAGNWKMYKTASETSAFFEKFRPLVQDSGHCEIVICPPFVNLPAALRSAAGSRIEIGGQNLFWAKEGAYTGEVSAGMLKALGCAWVIIGHSERRQYFGETDQSVLKKTVAALDAGLKPIVCVGEMLEEREAGNTELVLQQQFQGGIAGLTPEQFSAIVIAYEPVWAIGTGRTPTGDQIAEVHALMRERLSGKVADAAGVRLLYGGSVKPGNAAEIFAIPHVDGALVGGASLKAVDFGPIIAALSAA